MGKHQWLPNGNLLVTETMHGRAFELDPQKTIVWEYLDVENRSMSTAVEEVQRIPNELAAKVVERAAACRR
jgi:hypothetical protein